MKFKKYKIKIAVLNHLPWSSTAYLKNKKYGCVKFNQYKKFDNKLIEL